METHSTPGRVQVTDKVFASIKQSSSVILHHSAVLDNDVYDPFSYIFYDRGFIDVKSKGKLHTYFLLRAPKMTRRASEPQLNISTKSSISSPKARASSQLKETILEE